MLRYPGSASPPSCRGLVIAKIPNSPSPADATNAAARLVLDDNHAALLLFGQSNEHLRLIERELGVGIHARGNELSFSGPTSQIALARSLVEQLYSLVKRGRALDRADIARAMAMLSQDRSADIKEVFQDTVLVASRARPVSPKGLKQKAYVDAIREHDIVFGIGPAGTGKTYLAMAMAVRSLLERECKRIVLARPAVEAGEKLGFLPGNMAEKVNPYLRPLYDALHDMMDFERAEQLIERGVIEVAPLAFMRGRTLNDAFVILDEAQNATSEQMRMFLTRLGFNSKAVITGDVTQVDLPSGQRSGLAESARLLEGISGIAFCSFTELDVVRHPLVQKIILAYEKRDAERRAQ